MTTWQEFGTAAPRIAAIFTRRLAAIGDLCLLVTLRADGSSRISPVEPRVFEGRLVLTGLPDARKFADLAHDPRLCLHTAVVDSRVGDGDVKLFGSVVNMVNDRAQQRRFAAELYADTGFDLRGGEFRDYYAVEPIGASSVELIDGHLDITVWRPGAPERVVRTH